MYEGTILNKPWLIVAWLFIIELVVILLLVPGDWTGQAIYTEANWMEQQLGAATADKIMVRAHDWYQWSMIDSGVYAEMQRFLIPSEPERLRSIGMRTMGADWFEWVNGRLQAIGLVVEQFYRRIAMLQEWAPYMLILLVPAVYDGLMTWQIKRTNFDYASPVLHRYSVRAGVLIVVTLLLCFFLPFALNPFWIPVALMLCCACACLMFGNLQKRI